MNQLKYVTAIKNGDFTGLPISSTSTAVNLTGSWKFFRPRLAAKESPCRLACPLNIPIAAWLDDLQKNRPDLALRRLRDYNPLPAVTGRVCPHFCREACNRGDFDEAVRIGDLERYLGDLGLEHDYAPAPSPGKERVAVVGCGPAGLGAAVFLARRGIKVTIFEKGPAPGGLLRSAIPAYRLPREILERELAVLLRDLPLEIICNREIRATDRERLEREYDQVIWAPGLQVSRKDEAWPDDPRLTGALEMLAAINAGAAIGGDDFIIIGGGNAALDTARCLLRLGKKAEIIYRRKLAEMPAYAEEQRQAKEEGVVIHDETLVGKIDPTATKLRLSLHQARPDKNRINCGPWLRDIEVDGLIAAIGQGSDLEISGTHPVISAGDFAHGAASVAKALASGRRAAETVLRRLGRSFDDENQPGETAVVTSREQLHLDYFSHAPAISPQELAPRRRLDNFCEISQTLTAEQAAAENRRCFHCGICTACGICWFFCPDVAIAFDREAPDPNLRVLFDEDHCKGCGQCATVCPRGVIEMEEDH